MATGWLIAPKAPVAGITFWASEKEMLESESLAEQTREAGARAASAQFHVERYEVVASAQPDPA